MSDPADRLYFRQLLSGRDFAVGDPLAGQMVNFVYAIGDRATGECVLVDPAYAVDDLLGVLAADGMRLTGVLATHYHPDHIGGSMMGHTIEGVPALLEHVECPVHVQAAEAPWVARVIEIPEHDLVTHAAGDVVKVGEIEIELLHTPGHTPGSQCLLVDGRDGGRVSRDGGRVSRDGGRVSRDGGRVSRDGGRVSSDGGRVRSDAGRTSSIVVTGDTLFLDGCGRTDLPGSDPELMYDSLHDLAKLPEGTVVFPGHRYSMPSSATMSSILEQNYVYKPSSKDQWMTMFGR